MYKKNTNLLRSNRANKSSIKREGSRNYSKQEIKSILNDTVSYETAENYWIIRKK